MNSRDMPIADSLDGVLKPSDEAVKKREAAVKKAMKYLGSKYLNVPFEKSKHEPVQIVSVEPSKPRGRRAATLRSVK